MFSNLSASSISLATVTPSLVIRGAPNDLSRTTLRPFGPSVTLTALARISTPRSILSRASTPSLTSLADIFVLPELKFVSHLRGSTGRRSSTSERLRPSALGRLLGAGDIGENAHDVVLLHDQKLLAVDLDL